MWGYKPETFCDNQTLLLNPLVRDFSLSLFSDPFVLSIHLQEVTAVNTYDIMTDNRRVRVYCIHCRYQYLSTDSFAAITYQIRSHVLFYELKYVSFYIGTGRSGLENVSFYLEFITAQTILPYIVDKVLIF